jgi:uncharacterized phiE125 gp8 family phage protein
MRPSILSLSRTVQPEVEPVATSDLKSWLGYGGTDQDAVFDSMIVAAREWSEQFLARQLITATWQLKMDFFDWTVIDLPRQPIQSVSSIVYVDSQGVSQTLSSSLYDFSSDSGRIAPVYNESWPDTRDELEPVTITFIAGYGDEGHDVPEPIRRAILLIASSMWMSVQGCAGSTCDGSGINKAGKAMLYPYRIMSV